jgi:hypothetical protein
MSPPQSRSPSAASQIDVRVYSDFDALPSIVTDFFMRADERGFFWSATWFRIVMATAGQAFDRPRIHVAVSNDRVSAILVVRERLRAGPLKTRVITSPSRGADAAIYAPLLDPEHGEAGLSAIIASMLSARPPVHVFRFECVDLSSAEGRALLTAVRRFGIRSETFPDPLHTYSEDVAGLTVSQYIARRSPEMQTFIEAQIASFAQSARGRFAVVTGGKDFAPAIIDYGLVDLQSWKEQEVYPDCLAQLLESTAREGLLRLGFLYVDQQVAAAQIWIVSGGRATMWRSHFARKFALLSVGTVITYEMIREILLTDKPRELEFGPAADTGRQRWLEHRHDRIGIVAFNLSSGKGCCVAIRHYIGIFIRSALQLSREALARLTGIIRKS